MRNDSSLITGLSSASVNKVAREKAAREARAKARDEKRTTLAPVAQLITEAFKNERDAAKLRLLGVIDTQTPDDEVKSIIAALNLYAESMNNLEFKLLTLMKRGKND